MPKILYQDDAIIVVNKPAGLLAVPGRGEYKQDSVSARIQQVEPQARIVHRLDCHTSGLMLMAIGDAMQRALNRQFHDRQVEKKYIAIVNGIVTKRSGEIDLPMRGDPDNRPYQIIDCEHGKPALTRWRVLETVNGRTRLLLIPVTGRTHQLRLHCMVMGHAIVGDQLYEPEPEIEPGRMLLHAYSLKFTHPLTGDTMKLSAPCDF